MLNKKIPTLIGIIIILLLAGGVIGVTFLLRDVDEVIIAEKKDLIEKEEKDFLCGDSFIDTRDNQSYSTVQIGDQCWMAENLNYTASNYWCPDNDCNNRSDYGLLYNWYGYNRPEFKVCPEGWHLPSNNEWRTLVDFLDSNSGIKLKASDNDILGWNGTNESGFAALPAGIRHTDNGFYGFGSGTRFWSSNESMVGAWAWILSSDWSFILSNRNIDKKSGLSVRCIEDIKSLDDWSIYKNKELGFEFRVPPLFEEIGCTIREISFKPFWSGNDKECFVLSFDTMPTDPLCREADELGEFIRLYVCPLSCCKEEGLEGLCEAMKKGEFEFNEQPLFTNYITENNEYFIYSTEGPSHGDFYNCMGWLPNQEIQMLRDLMASSIKFIDDLSEEEQKKWMEEAKNTKCNYDDDFASPEEYGYVRIKTYNFKKN